MTSRRFVSRWLILALCLATLWGSPSMGEPLPVVVVTLPPIDMLMQKIEYLTTVTGFADAPQVQLMKESINGFARGLDRERPLAVMLQADEDSFQVFVMVPVIDFDAWRQTLPAMGSPVNDLGNGTYQVQVGPQALVLAADGGWAYLTRSAEELPLRPSDPLQVLQGLDAQYDLAVRFIVQNIPEGPRDFALNQYRNLMQMAVAQAAASNSPGAEFQRANMERQFAEVQRFADEADLITLGLRIAPSRQTIIGEFSMTAVAGSRLDRRMAVTDKSETKHASFFFPAATATASMSHPLLPEDADDQAEQFETVLKMARTAVSGEEFPGTDTAKQELNAVLDEFGGIVKETLAGGVVDSAMTLATSGEQLNVIAATRMSGGDRWEGILQRLQSVAEEMEIPADFRLGFTQQDDVRFHAAQFTLPESKILSRAFGEKLTVYLGVTNDTMYVGVGDKSLAGLKKAIAASSGAPEPVPPFRGLLSVGGIVQYVAHVLDRPEAQVVADAFRDGDQNDQIRVSQKLDRRGSLVTRLEIQDGVLAGVGRSVRQRMESR